MIDRNILKYGFDLNNFPVLTCPRCRSGLLSPVNKLESYHPPYSEKWQREDWAGFEDAVLMVSTVIRCNNQHCGEQGAFHAKGGVEPDYDHNGDTHYEEWFKISSIDPAPHIISFPTSTPDEVEHALTLSFSAFWLSKELAGNALRQSLEGLLSHFGVPDEVNGKWVSLGNRVQVLEQQRPGDGNFFKALRPILNASSHGKQLELEELLDVFEAYEIYLEKVFNDREERFKELTEKLLATQERKKGREG